MVRIIVSYKINIPIYCVNTSETRAQESLTLLLSENRARLGDPVARMAENEDKK